jgi:hypothetical protein
LKKTVGTHDPSFWCATLDGSWKPTKARIEAVIEADSSLRNNLRLNERCKDDLGCLRTLIFLCSEPHPIKVESGDTNPYSPQAFQQWRHKLKEKAKELLGKEPKDYELNSKSVSTWVSILDPGSSRTVELAKATGLTASDRDRPQPLARGVILVPPIKSLMNQMREWCDRTCSPNHAADSLVARAIRASNESLWDTKFKSTLWPEEKQSVPLSNRVSALSDLARLLTAIGLRPPDSSTDAATLLDYQHVAMLERIELKPSAQAPTTRKIPCRIGEAATSRQPSSLYVNAIELAVGAPSAPATCEQAIFEAIEKIDWRLWAIDAISTSQLPGFDDESRRLLRDLLSKVEYDSSENLKIELLGSKSDANLMARGVEYAVVARLTLETMPAEDGVVRDVIDDFRDLETALLVKLYEVDEKGLGGLTPPRRSKHEGVDVFRWRAQRVYKESRWRETVWERDPAPVGTQLGEQMQGRVIRLRFSASPHATDDDTRLLSAPYVTISPTDPAENSFAAPLHAFGAEILRPQEQQDGARDISAEIGAAMARLRGGFSGQDRGAFDALIKAATASPADPHATRWVELLRNDTRFAFDCHPPIRPRDDGHGYEVCPVSIRDNLVWESSDRIPERNDIRVVHALDRKCSTRVLSRGTPVEGSPEALAARLDMICEGDLARLMPAAGHLRRAIDFVRTFPDERDRMLKRLRDMLCGALDEVATLAMEAAVSSTLDGPEGIGQPLSQAFELLAAIGARYGYSVEPEQWNPKTGTPAADRATADTFPAFFHPTIPPGDVIVDQFALSGDDPRQGIFRQSAGPAPVGYESLVELAGAVGGSGTRLQELRERLERFPRRVLEDKTRLAIPSLYDSVWNVLVEHPAAAGDLEPWKKTLAEFIRKPFDMVMFEPSKLGDYPSSWIVGPDGKSPRGRRIARVIRPGVRTLEKKLVWPAVVETE